MRLCVGCLTIFFLFFHLSTGEAYHYECPLTSEEKDKLISSSSHWVDDVRCNSDENLEWLISNQRAIDGTRLSFSPKVEGESSISRGIASEEEGEEISEQPKVKKEELTLAPKSEEREGHILDKDESGIFDLSLGVGAYYYSHSQSGVLGSANIEALFLDKFSLTTSYQKGNFKLAAGATSYKFNYEFSGNENKRRMYETDLKLFYRSLFVGGRLEQKPLFKNSNGSVEMVAETSVIPTLGFEFDFSISKTIPTFLMLRPSVSYFMDSSSNETSVKLSDQSGYGADLDITLKRKLNTSMRFPTYYFWSNNFSYRKFERDVSWGNSIGSVETKHIDYNSTIGLMIEF